MRWGRPLSVIYGAVTELKNDLFNRKRLKIHRVSIPVLSIGNLTVGGTGKTPFVDYVIHYFQKKQVRVGVVARAYKAQAKDPIKVDLKLAQGSSVFGDEPLWLARRNPQVSVFVGARKWEIAQMAVRAETLDLLLVDDGFQHRQLHRDLDILILDATEKWENYQVLPLGRARESFENKARAQVVVLSKCNWASPEEVFRLKERVSSSPLIVETVSLLKRFRNFKTGGTRLAQDFKTSSALLFSSIARPEIFKENMRQVFNQVEALPFPDHHIFDADDIASILRKKKSLDYICCTEKEAVKLDHLWPDEEDLWVVELEIEIRTNEEKLHEIFDQFCP